MYNYAERDLTLPRKQHLVLHQTIQSLVAENRVSKGGNVAVYGQRTFVQSLENATL